MAYSTNDQVNNLLGPHEVTSTTPVTLTDMTQMRTNISGQIDAVLAQVGVTTPVTDATFSAFLASVESWGVAAEALKAAFPEAIGPGESPAYAFWQKKYTDQLERFRLRKDIPEGLLGATDRFQPSSYFTKYPDQEAIRGSDIGELAGKPAFEVDNLDERPW